MKKPLIVLTGPTAVGKTSLSISLARHLDGEIISADSMQVYRHMNIGSAKIRREEMEGIPHYLVDVLEPTEEFNIVLFQQMAREALDLIYAKGKIPILVGGTGFYIQAVTRDIDFARSGPEDGYRRELERIAGEQGSRALHQMLLEVDPVSARSIHENNVKRVIRALEFYHQNGTPISAHNQEEREKNSPYNLAYFVLNMPRPILYERIDKRVDAMLGEGLVEEVKALRDMGCQRGMTSMQGLGYKEILDYLEGDSSLEEAADILKRDTRHFAKRQLTWFRREPDVIWVNKEDFAFSEDAILDHILKECAVRGIKRSESK
ncbi:MAG: tRNA (adenosine(37)-N6)-dimethylallyltransferase MiaA [Clostridiales bacterium]|nr:tRNA (adenosine(37)-N6)-dimethylallyltransferase MiaA [Clostridiales bacterium]